MTPHATDVHIDVKDSQNQRLTYQNFLICNSIEEYGEKTEKLPSN